MVGQSGSPAEKAGLRGDDIITRIGRMETRICGHDPMLRSHRPGETVEIMVRRGDGVTTVRATLGRGEVSDAGARE